MSDSSGVGLVELAILETLDELGAGHDRPHVKCARIVGAIEDRIGLAPGYAYEILVDLARPWTFPIRLIDFHGNYGSRDFPPAGPRYVESRLSRAGSVVLAAERGELGPVPVGLINGSTYRQGRRPPFDPLRMITVLQTLLADPTISDASILDSLGPPGFPTDCEVSGDLAGFAAGHGTSLRITGRVTVADAGHVVIHSLPPFTGPAEITQTITRLSSPRHWARAFPQLHAETQLNIVDATDHSSRQDLRIVCTVREGTDPEETRALLIQVPGVFREIAVDLGAPLPDLVRSWVNTHRNQDLETSLTTLRAAIVL